MISLKCNECNSVESWDKCTNKERTCPPDVDQCLKIYAKYGETKVYARSCATKDFCNEEKNPVCKASKGISGAECDITCCDKDLCNAGSATKISGIVLLACSLVFLALQEAWVNADSRFHKLLFLGSCHGKARSAEISILLIHSYLLTACISTISKR